AAAQAERDQMELLRQSALLTLHAQLFEAYQNRQQAIEAAMALTNEVIPALENALRGTHEAYERGRYSYVDLIAAQRELLDARKARIEAAEAALVFGALIEQFTAEPLSLPSPMRQN